MNTKKLGFMQALSVTLYCLLIGIAFWLGPQIFPKINPPFGPVMFLLLFSASALICGLLVFYKPYKLFFAGKKKEAADVVVFTSISLMAFAFTFFILMVIFK